MLEDYRDKNWEEVELNFLYDSYLEPEFEKFCFIRFGAILNFLEQSNIEKFIYVDSDIILLNREILDHLVVSLQAKRLACLAPISTYFSAWRRETLSEFVQFFPKYFSSEAGGDRHCDMFALSEFVKLLGPEQIDVQLSRYLSSYTSEFYFKDPNFSFAPILMKFSGVWDYRELARTHYPIDDIIKFSGGKYFYRPYPTGPELDIDFVHLNGDTKVYHEDFRRLIIDSERLSS
jgi:hypothetical protein